MKIEDLINVSSITKEVKEKVDNFNSFKKLTEVEKDSKFSDLVIANRFLLGNVSRDKIDLTDEELGKLNMIYLIDHIIRVGYVPVNYYKIMKSHSNDYYYKNLINSSDEELNFITTHYNVYKLPFTTFSLLNLILKDEELDITRELIDKVYNTQVTLKKDIDVFKDKEDIRDFLIYLGLFVQTDNEKYLDKIDEILNDNELDNEEVFKFLDRVFPTVCISDIKEKTITEINYKREVDFLDVLSNVHKNEIIRFIEDKIASEEVDRLI